MTTRSELQALLEAGGDYESIGARLGIAPGLVYMIANGVPADNSDAGHRSSDERPIGPQRLVNPRQANPAIRSEVVDWVKRRAAADLSRDDG